MSFLYTIVSRLFTNKAEFEPQPEQDVEYSDEVSIIEPDPKVTIDDSDKITELQRLVSRLEERLIESKQQSETYKTVAEDMQDQVKYIENKYNKECEKTRMMRANFLKEPDVSTLFTALDHMTVNQFKNIIPKMDLANFSDLTTKDKYLNACMFMFVRKFNSSNRSYNVNEFIDYVITNDALTVDVRSFFTNENNIEMIKKELYNFYEFAKLFVE